MVVIFRVGVAAGIAALLHLQTSYMSKEHFGIWEKGHDVLRDKSPEGDR